MFLPFLLEKSYFRLTLRVSKASLESANILVHRADVVGISEDKSSLLVKSTGYDVFCIIITNISVVGNILLIFLAFHEILLIVSQLDDNWAFEHVLQIFCEEERKTVAKMHSSRRTSSSV
jgi:hypothetical protein